MLKFKDLYPLYIFVPSIILVHYGWYRLQFNEELVPESERRLDIWSHYKLMFKTDKAVKDTEDKGVNTKE